MRVRQAVNLAINRAGRSSTRVYSGEAEYSGHVPPGYGPWPLTDAELKDEVREVRPADGEEADGGGRLREGLLGHDDDVLDACTTIR